ncbi:hypothetical protein V3C99_016377 [Haemonchus contortus]
MDPKHFRKPAESKYVGFLLNHSGLDSQLFHLITGYGIARVLGRTHYLPFNPVLQSHVQGYLNDFKEVFPRLEETYVLGPEELNVTAIPFGDSCCAYDNLIRLVNNSDKYILLKYKYGQKTCYFDGYLDAIRQFLTFSRSIRNEGDSIINSLEIKRNSWMCIHIRRTDFNERKISTDVNLTVNAANTIAKKTKAFRFLLFGDDYTFMKDLANEIIERGNWQEDAAVISNHSDYMDLYLSSQLCRSFLISAPTSTFGWLLAFFIPDQNAVYYTADERNQDGKIVTRELFM